MELQNELELARIRGSAKYRRIESRQMFGMTLRLTHHLYPLGIAFSDPILLCHPFSSPGSGYMRRLVLRLQRTYR
jgi:hypothetical protein